VALHAWAFLSCHRPSSRATVVGSAWADELRPDRVRFSPPSSGHFGTFRDDLTPCPSVLNLLISQSLQAVVRSRCHAPGDGSIPPGTAL
jgi:hypothetical protein